MPAFEYVAITASGKKQSGVKEADSERVLRQALRESGLTPFEIKPAKEKSSFNFSFQRGISTKERALIVRQLATLIGAGLPYSDALSGVIEQSKSRKVRSMMMAIRSKITEGHGLAVAMGDYPKVFNEFYRFSVQAAEDSGRNGDLASVLNELAEYSDRMEEQKQKVQMALIYPVLLTVVAACIVTYLLISVMPDIVSVFQKQNAELPGLTSTLLAISAFIRANGLVALVALALVVATYKVGVKRHDVRLARDRLLLKLPIVRTVNSSRYISTLALLTKSGVPIDKSMTIAAKVVNNTEASNRLAEARESVKGGSSLMKSLKATSLLSPMMLQLIDSGERTGELGAMLERSARQQQQDTANLVKAAVTLFEPIMLLVMGGAVMLIVMSIIMPIMSMNQLIS